MITFFATSAGVLSALFIALVVALQMLSFGQLMKVSLELRRSISGVMAYTGFGIVISLGMVAYSEAGLPLLPIVAVPAFVLVGISVVLLVVGVPYFKAMMDREVQEADAKVEHERLDRTVEELESLAKSLKGRMDAMQATLSATHDGPSLEVPVESKAQ